VGEWRARACEFAGTKDGYSGNATAADDVMVAIARPGTRLWRASAQMLGLCDRHLPQPVRHSTEIVECSAREMPWGTEMHVVMRSPRLSQELVAR
jgi:hypothetical protein